MEATLIDRPVLNPSRLRWRSWQTVVLVCVLLFYAFLCIKRSEGKLLWFDELGTLNVSSQSTLKGMFRVEPADGNPPLQYVLARTSLRLLGTTAFALRLPAMCGAGLAIVCAYLFVGRRFGPGTGLLAATLLLLNPVSDYGVEARPYALLLGLVALLLVFWQQAAGAEPRTGALVGVALTVFALTIAQPFGVLWAVVPLLAGEATRWRSTRRLDRAMMRAILLGLCGFAVTLYFGHETQQALAAPAGTQHPVISLPTFSKLRDTMRSNGMFPPAVLLLPAGLLAWWLRGKDQLKSGKPQHGAPVSEWAAVSALALTMFVIYLATVVGTHYFWNRYLAPSVLGWVLALAMACGSVCRWPVTVAVLFFGLLLIGHDRRPRPGQAAQGPRRPQIVSALLSQGDPARPVVIENAVQYPQVWWYSPPELRARLHYVADAQQAIPTGDFMGDLTLIAMHDAGSALFPTDTLPGFLTVNKRFLLWQGKITNGNWLGGYLRTHGYEFATVAKDDSGETLFEVSAPASVP